MNPQIAVKLINSGKVIIQTNGRGKSKSVIYNIYGKDIAENILKVNYTYEDIKITGVIGKPAIARSNRSNQLFFVNKRYIKDKTLTGAAEQGFKGMLTIGKYGFLILNLKIDPHKIDINVHPAKLEVRFEEESKVFKAVYHAIKDTLLQGDLVREPEKQEENERIDNEFKKNKNAVNANMNSINQNPINTNLLNRNLINQRSESKETMKEVLNQSAQSSIEKLSAMNPALGGLFKKIIEENEMKKIENANKEIKNTESRGNLENIEKTESLVNQKNSSKEEKIEENKSKIINIEENKEKNEENLNSSNETNEKTESETEEIIQEIIENPTKEDIKRIIEKVNSLEDTKIDIDSKNFEEMYVKTFGKMPSSVSQKLKEDTEEYKFNEVAATINDNISIFTDLEKNNIPQYKFIGIAFKTYIIMELDNELYILDQHAAHERIMYEKVKKNYYTDGPKESQLMLLPDIITLTHKEMGIAKDNLGLFEKAGFTLEEFGENTIKISGVPNICINLETKELFLETLDEINTVARTAKQEIEEKFIATIACKSAVKANMALTKEEVDNLMSELLVLPNPFTCPHGRPTAIKMSKIDIEKKFSRR